MGTVGDAYDNALCESFFATLECELLDRERFRTPAEARRAVFDYIEGWYNPRRRHSALGYESPLRYERIHAAEALRAPAPEKARAVEPPGATLTEGGATSVSPKSVLPPVLPPVVEHEPTVFTFTGAHLSSSPSTKPGQLHRHSEAFSFQIATDNQEETDRYWNAIVGNGGKESQCGWCKDRWGLSWQITRVR